MTSKEVTFKKFDPKGSISIYQFLSSYEDWCHGYIFDSQKPRLLFTKYLHPSLTTSYKELKARRHDYGQMKTWLNDNFSSVKAVADNHLQAIRAPKTPKVTDDALMHAIYIRKMHRLLTTLYNLKIRKGIRVPQLQEYIIIVRIPIVAFIMLSQHCTYSNNRNKCRHMAALKKKKNIFFFFLCPLGILSSIFRCRRCIRNPAPGRMGYAYIVIAVRSER
jgi:hypothetical protein